MRNRGQIGDLIASITVLIGVIGVLALFALFSTGILGTSIVKDKLDESTTSEIKPTNMDVLFEPLVINGKNKLAFKALQDAWDQDLDEDQFKSEIKRLTPDGSCTFISWRWSGKGATENFFGYLIFGNESETITLSGDYRTEKNFQRYESSGLLSEVPISFSDKIDNSLLEDFNDEITYMAYRGECK